jgi:hypothetical protein
VHKLAAIGDSLTMGFCSGAIYKTQDSYPSMIARALGIGDSFLSPAFDIDNGTTGGFPLNIEMLLNNLETHYPKGLNFFRFIQSLFTVNSFMHKVEKFWERSDWIPDDADPYHNLAVLSYTVQEAYGLTNGICSACTANPTDQVLLFDQIPDHPMYRAALGTMATRQSLTTTMTRLAQLSESGGIENLIVALGANNCLGAVIGLQIVLSEEADLSRQPHERKCTLWLPEHFDQSLETLVHQIKALQVENVFIATVPHVTIPPVTRGTPPQHTGKYYDYYTRPWIWDSSFDPALHPYLRKSEVIMIDEFVDSYNASIRNTAQENGWHVVDFCGFLDTLAFRRQHGAVSYKWPDAAKAALAADPGTSYIVGNGTVKLDTRYMKLVKRGLRIQQGGLFSLDAVHPTRVMYGLIAEEFLAKMRSVGVTAVNGSAPALDWASIVSSDSLLTSPPKMLADMRGVLTFLSGSLFGKILFKVLESFKTSVG